MSDELLMGKSRWPNSGVPVELRQEYTCETEVPPLVPTQGTKDEPEWSENIIKRLVLSVQARGQQV